MNLDFISILEILGTFAFAVSGIRHAYAFQYDFFGAFCLGFVVAVGGGTIRDVLLNVEPFWFKNSIYVIICVVAYIFTSIFKKTLIKLDNYLLLFDTIGISLFCIAAADKIYNLGYTDFHIIVILSTITCVAGGILRDIFTATHPTVFKTDLYATACILGACLFCILQKLQINQTFIHIIVPIFVFIFRYCCIFYFKKRKNKIFSSQ